LRFLMTGTSSSRNPASRRRNRLEFRGMSPFRLPMTSVLMVLVVLFGFPGTNTAQVADDGKSKWGEVVVLRNATVVDVRTGALRPEQAVMIRGGKIRWIGASREAKVALDARTIDCSGLFVIAASKLIGPRIYTSGPMLDGPKPRFPSSLPIATPEQGRSAVDDLKGRGADFIKLQSLIPRDAVFAIADEAAKQGMAFLGHVPDAVRASEMSERGMKSFEHLIGIFEGSSPEESEFLKGGKTERKLLATYDAARAAKLCGNAGEERHVAMSDAGVGARREYGRRGGLYGGRAGEVCAGSVEGGHLEAVYR